MDIFTIQQIGTAVLLTVLIGLEREKHSQLEKFPSFAGVRTFALIGLFGSLSYILKDISPYFLEIISAGFLILIVTSYVVSALKHGDTGLTTEIAAVLAYVIGILSAMEKYILATLVAIFVLMFLYFKDFFHALAKKLKQEEIISTIKFIVIAFVILPLLPNQWYGPFDFFNPYIVWLMVVFISGISFASYVAMRIFGSKWGILLSGFFGGLISSTGLTLTFAHLSKKQSANNHYYLVAILVACSAMFFRILLEIFILSRVLFLELIWPMLIMGMVIIIFASYFYFRITDDAKKERAIHDLQNPFKLKPALSFGLFFSAMLFIIEFAKYYFGDQGVYLTSFISSIFDVDPITISLAQLINDNLAISVAVVGILIAAVTNTFVKGAMVLLFGDRKLAGKILMVFLIASLTAFGSIFLF